MMIDLLSIKSYYINEESQVERDERTHKLLSDLKFTNFKKYSAKKGKTAIEGCALSHIDILKNNIDKLPIIIFEDDIVCAKNYNSKIDVPDDVDAVYLGYSLWGYDKERAKKHSKMDVTTSFKQINSSIYKISHMLSTHSILYWSKEYTQAAISSMESVLFNNKWHCDYACAQIQHLYNVYAPNSPYFCQNQIWTLPWTYVPLDKFFETNLIYSKQPHGSRFNP